MGKISWFCSWRALLHPQESPWSRGCQRSSPGGERCRLCQVSRHKEHTWSGTTCPGPAQSPGQEQSQQQPQDVLKGSNTQGLQGSDPCWLHSAGSPARGQHRIWALQPQELLQSPGKSRAAAPLPSQNCHPRVPFPGKQRFLCWTEREAEVITDTLEIRSSRAGTDQAAPGGLQEQSQSWHIPALTRTQTLQLPSPNTNTEPSEPSQSCSVTATQQSWAAATGKRL